MPNATPELLLYEPIGEPGITAKTVVDRLAAMPDAREITVRINSPGGSVFESIGIHAALKQHQAKVTAIVDGVALSGASLVLMAGDTRIISANGIVMIHDPFTSSEGGADELRKAANMVDKIRDSLATIYSQRTGRSMDQVRQWMAAETWFNAAEAKAMGFVDSVAPGLRVAAGFNLYGVARVPERFQAHIGAAAVAAWNGAIAAKVAAGMSRPDAIRATAKADPRLHASYLAAYTRLRRRVR